RQAATIRLRLDVAQVLLGIDQAMPFGLIVNELVSNSLKHAFAPGASGEIRVRLHPENGGVYLTVADDGRGFPAEIDFRQTPSLGLQLVNTLTRQLGGTVELRRDGGTEFRITFRAI
ncbi:MAG: sensor histidine kinase, partial [Armatimonadota bacterium]|nr:sensor histidine kinase [Armatimonadota bacterium]